jgi:hypothetical protein
MLTATGRGGAGGVGCLDGVSRGPLYSRANGFSGTGADVIKHIAAPMIGGMVSSTTLTLVVIPVLYFVRNHRAMSSGPAIETTFARPVVLIGAFLVYCPARRTKR